MTTYGSPHKKNLTATNHIIERGRPHIKFMMDGFQKSEATLPIFGMWYNIFVFIARGLLSFVTNYLMTWISTRLVVDLRRAMFDKLLGALARERLSQTSPEWN